METATGVWFFGLSIGKVEFCRVKVVRLLACFTIDTMNPLGTLHTIQFNSIQFHTIQLNPIAKTSSQLESPFEPLFSQALKRGNGNGNPLPLNCACGLFRSLLF